VIQKSFAVIQAVFWRWARGRPVPSQRFSAPAHTQESEHPDDQKIHHLFKGGGAVIPGGIGGRIRPPLSAGRSDAQM